MSEPAFAKRDELSRRREKPPHFRRLHCGIANRPSFKSKQYVFSTTFRTAAIAAYFASNLHK
ncbi:MAG: hypothetical protein EP320_09830 [Rhodobacteraceae bacterium]|nr:MAG: hypothetical protein EP320_09830 [Paracoccaceae bacterium]